MKGAATEHPEVQALVAGPDPGAKPHYHTTTDGRTIVHYSRSRLWFIREAWDALPTDGILVVRVQPTDGPDLSVAMTRQELEATFGTICRTVSWQTSRCYHYPRLPRKAEPFIVAPPVPASAAMRSPTSRSLSPPTPSRQDALHHTAVSLADVALSSDIATWARAWAQQAGVQAESAAYLARVEAWRQVCRPPLVRILLVAESHVAEAPGDLAAHVHLPIPIPESMPTGYVRLVYCLGYGEDAFCNPRPTRNAGTWQYWDLFGAVVGGLQNQQPRRGNLSTADRLRWKLHVLRTMRARGIWLVDAAVAGLYQPGGGRPFQGRRYQDMIRDSYSRFVWPGVSQDPIEQVWVIGRGIGTALAGLPGIDPSCIISQPQDHDVQRFRDDLARVVQHISP